MSELPPEVPQDEEPVVPPADEPEPEPEPEAPVSDMPCPICGGHWVTGPDAPCTGTPPVSPEEPPADDYPPE